jgi:hypothetical protein
LGLREIDEIELEILDRGEPPAYDRYDVIVEEDHFAGSSQSEEGMEHLLASRRILLGDSSQVSSPVNYDEILSKPFLPEEIRSAVLGEIAEQEPLPSEESLEHFLEEGEGERGGTKILDEGEIQRIRRLLEGEMEEEMEKSPAASPKEALHRASYDVDEFVELLERCKIKKLKRLLRGSRIHITIEFPEEER